ncbi:MAG TPA: hypothetical protein VFC99_20225 [Acidimicrobiia bacterium]|nr:hypothetical protein [Acidimicrobiia bacterium]
MAVRDGEVLAVMDDDGEEVVLDATEADALFALTNGLEAATVSACPDCRSRVLACVALVDVLDAAPPLAQGPELIDLADEAPTLHLYVQDLGARCRHRRWLDPGHAEWAEALAEFTGPEASR